MRVMEAFAEGCGRVGSIDPITVPELAKKAQQALASRCNQPLDGPAVQVKFADTGKTVQRLAVISGAGGSLFEDALAHLSYLSGIRHIQHFGGKRVVILRKFTIESCHLSTRFHKRQRRGVANPFSRAGYPDGFPCEVKS